MVAGGRAGLEDGVLVVEWAACPAVDQHRFDGHAGLAVDQLHVRLRWREVPRAPLVQGDQDGAERFSRFGQKVFVAWRPVAVPVTLEFMNGKTDHFGRWGPCGSRC